MGADNSSNPGMQWEEPEGGQPISAQNISELEWAARKGGANRRSSRLAVTTKRAMPVLHPVLTTAT